MLSPEVYVYDSNGNGTSYIAGLVSATGTYDNQDRLTQYGNLQFTYTANGELLTKSNPTLGQTASFSYDLLGNLKTVSLPGGTVSSPVKETVSGEKFWLPLGPDTWRAAVPPTRHGAALHCNSATTRH